MASSPCAPLQGSGFYVGVAFWPGHTVQEWGLRYNTTSEEFGLSPCNVTVDPVTKTSHRAYLVRVTASGHHALCIADDRVLAVQAATGAVFASFEAKVDTMTALKFSAQDIMRVYNRTQNTTLYSYPVLSAVVFRYARSREQWMLDWPAEYC